MNNYKEIHIGELIHKRVEECEVTTSDIAAFLKLTYQEVEDLYLNENIETNLLLKVSKLLKYDFFRIYSHHLILYSPPLQKSFRKVNSQQTQLPRFRKNIYNKEIIDFILELIESKEKTKQQIINEYKIPKTTLFKWIKKYGQITN